MFYIQHTLFVRWSLVVVWCVALMTETSTLQAEDKQSRQSAGEYILLDARLVDGAGKCSGGAEVKSDQGWDSVCEDSFDSETQKMFCRELGCGPPQNFRRRSPKINPSLFKQFQCKGNESRLEDCVSFMKEECRQAAGITCSKETDLRLVGGETLCQGTLEGKQAAEWRPLEDGWNSLKPEHFAKVCGKMGCGGFISVSRNYLPELRPVWLTDCETSSSFCKSWRGTSSNLVLAVTCEGNG
uniref:SRCR domain-containing protein n=1 Tax=Labrus bergylta TaxID=56723 RepID=A0A3Q3FJB5_9LABR